MKKLIVICGIIVLGLSGCNEVAWERIQRYSFEFDYELPELNMFSSPVPIPVPTPDKNQPTAEPTEPYTPPDDDGVVPTVEPPEAPVYTVD